MNLRVALFLVLAGCAGRIPLPERLRVQNTAELLQRMRDQQAAIAAYSAEARLTYFGAEGRVRATATLIVERPTRLRYDVEGPHGGVISAFACNGLELFALDVGASRFFNGPATAENIDRLLPLPPLGLDPAGWVQLLFGELLPPPDASLRYDDERGRFVFEWPLGTTLRHLEVDPQTSRIVYAKVTSDHVVLSEVSVDERNDMGVPVTLRIKVPVPATDLEVRLRDVEARPLAPPTTFQLEVPQGISPEYIGGKHP